MLARLWITVSFGTIVELGGGYALLAITTKKPRAKMPATPILSLSFIWRRETIVMGKQMMMTSVKMLTMTRRSVAG